MLQRGTGMKNSGKLWRQSMEQRPKKQNAWAVCSLIRPKSFSDFALSVI
jgi:hypothetical protein